ncbi:glycosyltransferase family 4 protein [Bacillus sonorensis]|nr:MULTISPECIES: glycosyltransferase family 4 protein [Bacillus]MBG9914368.1 glycosyl transferase [Bacillus sonorensis]MCF7616383.1 glycosyltransferase family 4 protein [Bacillus sonorensis]MCY7857691.1 glycosyltransferase family 4 protein [Bacillus sonorensis]MCY8023602.1 glycosyltransferase family 4 protein [Bacillus sonorensis]MCY8033429.1 glycosyltransferase family 4 protein [Bacillus sonorensis]
MMRTKVCMFVWNHFTNDARVMRECTALSEDIYDVDLICIDDPKNPDLKTFEEYNQHFRVHRVKRYPDSMMFLQKVYKSLRQSKPLLLLACLLWLLGIYFLPIPVILCTFFAFVVLKTKLNTAIVRGSIILRMILKGVNKKYDIYHSNDLNTLPQGYICSKFRLKKKKLIYDSHEVQTSRTGYDSSFYGKMEAFLIKKIDAMIVENHTRAKYNEELYGFYPYVVHNYPFKQTESIEKVDLRKLLNLSENEKILLYQGGIQTGRGLENLVKAAPKFNEGTLVFIGDGRIKPDLEKMVGELGIGDRVKFLPKVPLADLPKYTRNAYLGFQVLNNVCFNHYSASSNKLFEYMMAGVPVVACNFPEIKRVVEGEGTGVIVDSHDSDSIAEGVNKLLSDPGLREELSKNSLRARDLYNWEQEKTAFLTVYSKFNTDHLMCE